MNSHILNMKIIKIILVIIIIIIVMLIAIHALASSNQNLITLLYVWMSLYPVVMVAIIIVNLMIVIFVMIFVSTCMIVTRMSEIPAVSRVHVGTCHLLAGGLGLLSPQLRF